ncbi:hypothetical protein GGR50DRAFT_694824 [Xylaria sp. CBS 124048]|nr:hypothetical protein GGR50DRAFT_694824 [Xylaria sp. CBS 124048]
MIAFIKLNWQVPEPYYSDKKGRLVGNVTLGGNQSMAELPLDPKLPVAFTAIRQAMANSLNVPPKEKPECCRSATSCPFTFCSLLWLRNPGTPPTPPQQDPGVTGDGQELTPEVIPASGQLDPSVASPGFRAPTDPFSPGTAGAARLYIYVGKEPQGQGATATTKVVLAEKLGVKEVPIVAEFRNLAVKGQLLTLRSHSGSTPA